ncbi:MAG: ATP-binding protein [Treponema sp.]|nr:ATP-binding protein [Treponema sp.]
MEKLQLLPLGVQDFSILREGNYIYVDKTSLIYELTQTNRAVFLSRPRRFGKSLLLSTIKYYFLGSKDLFRGLEIERLESGNTEPWAEYPVLYFDLNGQDYTSHNGLVDIIENHLSAWEKEYGSERIAQTPAVRFENVIRAAYEKTGKRVVVLVDEYDKPLLETMTVLPEIEEANRAAFKGIFGVLKKMDAYLRFYMFTGVTKFSKVSIFSDLNQLTDISLNPKYNALCGISQDELEKNFAPYIKNLADANGLSETECLDELRRMYDGYHFSGGGDGMYNPFSLLHCFDENRFGHYWFESGTPTFLINKLSSSNYDIRQLSSDIKISESGIKDYRPENADPVPLFYQSGYLTIKSWNQRQNSYRLGFPNAEVKYGFLNSLAPSYLHVEDKPAPFNIDILDDAVEEGDTDGMRDWFTALFALLPYPAGSDAESVTEQNFQNVIFMSLTMMGKYARTEVHSAKGRADCILETSDFVYVFEFKRDVPASEALKQIEEQGYAKAYSADKRKLFKIGVNFSTGERNIVEWEVVGR